ncbi:MULTISPECIES: magnesium transporter [unclassified Paenibacillus]|uniref:magnesium transporter n=1 Tax=unclassified Paenibacillus TaxID=185978 RepID=UPI001C111836|nr:MULTISPECIES: magnesium transporter [unclassified Paenibacillus]MBU5442697.1 magnesium transporter [Paenibacillus sp. MSJ-34]CAH0120984.1 Magnesium transporter MgtE [Paenibacillus sp. CECT 9249]
MVHTMSEEEIMLLVIQNIKEHKRDEIQQIIDELQPYDIGQLYSNLPEKHRLKFLGMLQPKQIANLIQELHPPMQIDILHKLGVQQSSNIMDLMENDDLADLLHQLSVDKIEQFLSSMQAEESNHIKDLLRYPPETAGGIMTNRYVWIRQTYTVREAVDKLKSFADIAENIYYLYVLDDNKRLVGVVSYRDLLLAELFDKVEDIMYTRVISVPVDMDQEQVARVIEQYDFISVPVIDEQSRLIGIVTVDDIVDVIIEEANEDIAKLSASGKTIDWSTSTLTAAARRLPWLVLLLGLGVLTGSILSGFEETLTKVVALTYFMPMISGMTGNTGTQSLVVVVRGLMSNEINRRSVMRLLLRELGVGVIIGAVCGILITMIAIVWQGDPVLGLVVGSTLLATLIIGTLAGTLIPLLLYLFKVDPAVASGPLITTLNDVFSLTVYFSIASLFISRLL